MIEKFLRKYPSKIKFIEYFTWLLSLSISFFLIYFWNDNLFILGIVLILNILSFSFNIHISKKYYSFFRDYYITPSGLKVVVSKDEIEEEKIVPWNLIYYIKALPFGEIKVVFDESGEEVIGHTKNYYYGYEILCPNQYGSDLLNFSNKYLDEINFHIRQTKINNS